MLFRDPHIEGAVGENPLKLVDTGAAGHGGRNCDDLVVFAGFLDQRFREHAGIAWGIRFRLVLFAGDDVELGDAVIFVVRAFRELVTLALLGDHVHQDRSFVGIAHVAQDRQQMVQIVAVDRPDIIEAEFFEQGAAGNKTAGIFLGLVGLVLDEFGKLLGDLLADAANRAVGRTGHEPRQMGAHGADRRRDRHVVVVQDHNQPRLQRAGIVHRLIGHAGRHGSVADDGNDIVVLAAQIPRDRIAQAR